MERQEIPITAPRRVDVYLTHQCNLSCPFCFYKEKSRGYLAGDEQRDLSVDQWLELFRELASLQVLEVGLCGGEALLYDGFWQLIDFFAASRMRFVLFSNGVLLDDEAVERLRASRRCSYVQISIDGPREQHDAIRGEGVFDCAVSALRRLREAGIVTHVNMVLTPGQAENITAAVRFLIEDVGVNAIRVNPVVGEGFNNQLDEREIAAAIRLLKPLQEAYPKILHSSGVLKYPRTLEHPFTPTTEKPCPDCEGILGIRCAVLANGAVIPCLDAESEILGNITERAFGELWFGEAWAAMRRRVREPRPLPRPDCEGCRYAANCRRNCLSRAVHCIDKICYRKLAAELAAGSVK